MALNSMLLEMLRCPLTGEKLRQEANCLISEGTANQYRVTPEGIPLFAESICSVEGKKQQEHYDRVAAAYLENLTYPHTQEYMSYLDERFLATFQEADTDQVAEICCGRGEAFQLLGNRVAKGVGVDVSVSMLKAASNELSDERHYFVQGDATMLPLGGDLFDSVVMLGGIHHVNDREKLFSEVFRILKPGGRFYWREPVSDFFLWRWIRSVIYRLSPALDHDTERPLLYEETVPYLEKVGFTVHRWDTYGFVGFCLFMNSDVLVFNRLFKYVPGIRSITRWSARLDNIITNFPLFRRAGLQVIGVAGKPANR